MGSTVDTASGQRAGEPRASGGHFAKWGAPCSEGSSGPLWLWSLRGAALRGGVQTQHPAPLRPKARSHRVRRSLCWGSRPRLDRTASRAAWSPGHLSLGCRLPARPPNPGAPRKAPQGQLRRPQQGTDPMWPQLKTRSASRQDAECMQACPSQKTESNPGCSRIQLAQQG